MFAYCLNNPINSNDPNGKFAIGIVLGKAAVGAAINIATTFIAAKVTGQQYSWKDALVAGVSGAIGTGNAIGFKITAGAISGVYAGIMAYKNGASIEGSLLAGAVSSVGTILAVSNIASWLDFSPNSLYAAFADFIFGTGSNSISAATYRSVVEIGNTYDSAYLAPPKDSICDSLRKIERDGRLLK